MDPIDFHSRKNTMEVNGVIYCSITDVFFLNIFFCVQQKKETHIGLEQLVYFQIILFG